MYREGEKYHDDVNTSVESIAILQFSLCSFMEAISAFNCSFSDWRFSLSILAFCSCSDKIWMAGWFEDFVYSCGRKVGNIFEESEFLSVCMYLNSERCVRSADRGCD